jgi:NADPH:quinone reductase-like Zn-dependent oxidoreductase
LVSKRRRCYLDAVRHPYGALRAIAKIGEGDFVAIAAASSTIGLAPIQIVNTEGAISIATTRKNSKKDELIRLGADHVISTDEEDYVARAA